MKNKPSATPAAKETKKQGNATQAQKIRKNWKSKEALRSKEKQGKQERSWRSTEKQDKHRKAGKARKTARGQAETKKNSPQKTSPISNQFGSKPLRALFCPFLWIPMSEKYLFTSKFSKFNSSDIELKLTTLH